MASPVGSEKPMGNDANGAAEVEREAKAFFERLGNWGLGHLMDLAKKEMKQRLAEAEKQVAEMKRQFNILPPRANIGKANKHSADTKTDKGRGITTATSTSSKRHGSRGKLTKAILGILASGPKTRADIEREVTARNLSTKSVATTLNRMKKAKKILHDDVKKTYALIPTDDSNDKTIKGNDTENSSPDA